uniref:SUN domain-containing protein n=1 Tax=Xiphophorus couchianus TaxID=32473 RepID=A0A3B5LSE1_9TELE
MDFSQLHTYTPPQCAPENTGYTYSLSSSYSTAALEFEKEHQISPVYESPKMLRRSLRLQNSSSHYNTENVTDYSLDHGSSYIDTRKETRNVECSVSLPQESYSLQWKSYFENQIWLNLLPGCHVPEQHSSQSSSNTNGEASFSKSKTSVPNGYICKDCSFHSQQSDSRVTRSSLTSLSSSSSSCQEAELSTDGHSSFCGSMNVKDLVTEETSHLNLNGSLLKAGKGLMWFLARGWYQLVSLMSLVNVFFLTRIFSLTSLFTFNIAFFCSPAVFWWWLPFTGALLTYLPAINLTEWRSTSRFDFFSNLAAVPAAVPATETPMEQAHNTPVSQATRQLAVLWEKVQAGNQKQDQRHSNVLGLYSSLREQVHSQNERESFEVWVSSMMEQRLGVLRGELQRENLNIAQSSEQQKQQQESQAARLANLELLLRALETKTEVFSVLFISVGVKQEDHDALLLEMQRLEAELSKIRGDLQGFAGCKGKCEQLNTLQQTVSSINVPELKNLFFGSDESADQQQGEIPESLIQWLSQRYVSMPNLQAALASIEMSILKNISLQLEHSRAQVLGEAESRARSVFETVRGTVRHTSTTEGLSEEDVNLIVQNALKLYSQDRTGQVDYALESGGGSILSTRCSETYETKTALMSLFGLPLWYFSQSPRVVIQPDVYPGNCWAFKGSQGYLVIRLSLRIRPTSFCVEHIPKTLSPTGNIASAPRNFTVFGLDDEYQEEGTLLGHYTYEEDGDSLQIFPVKEKNDKAFQIVEVRVLSNWGHPEYTCLYRFRVHGEPLSE